MSQVKLHIESITSELPEQEPLGRLKCVRIQAGVALVKDDSDEGYLSFTVACDLRDACLVCLEDNAGNLHQLDAGYASHGQRLRVPWSSDCTRMRVTEIEGAGALWVLAESSFAPEVVPIKASITERREAAFDRLRSNALCQFSWMGGCVLDGMWQLHQARSSDGWDDAIREWLAYFIQEEELHYQSPRGAPVLNRFNNIEGTLPVAVIAKLDPWHPVCDLALELFERQTREDGLIVSGPVTAEGCYTVAYPLAVVAKLRMDDVLADRVFRQLEMSRDHLFHEGDLYLRFHDGNRTFCNWTRGICWYLLGMVRCFSVLDFTRRPALVEHFQERARWIQKRQRPDGLWDNFWGESGFPPDSSGSCGIAAALMTGFSLGLLDHTAKQSAERCWEGVGDYLEPDGWLGCVAPNNKRGEAEQHTRSRTIEPFALGLYAQLAAALLKATEHDTL